ncbi:ABC transporter permease subunit [Sporosarcina highlanderae]|uniref:ABC transporter permease subunit n=1 Tax=Sporosarcina highlanderae TaxID=3035916 RepID=A0ABT8JVA2_9BACL|nr:ABC transporter permease subunit [Sporosarcina highlanderae]MDN4608476.1 ABC transporter permease subunit [Sporosarcina highlanderae]
MNKVLFEWKKITRLKVFLIFLQLTFVFVFGLYFYNHMSQDQIKVKKTEHFTELRKNVSRQLLQAEEEQKRRPSMGLSGQLHFGAELSAKLQQLIGTIQSGDWRAELQTEIDVYDTAIQYIVYDGAYFGVSLIDMELITKLNEELLKRNLPKEDFDLSIQTSIFMKKVVSLVMNPVGFVMLLFVLGLIVTKEFDDNTIRQVLTLPMTRIEYMFIKFITIVSGGVLWLALIFGSSYLLGELIGRSEGNIFQYPIYTNQDTFISSGKYLIDAVLYSFSFMTFSVGLLLFLAYAFRNTIVTFSALLFIMAGGWLLTSYGVQNMFNPFTYQMVDQAILQTPHYFPAGIAVLGVALLALLVATIMVNRKRGM